MKKYILLGIGIILSLVFMLFPEHIYEMFYYSPEFSDAMYNSGQYFLISIVTTVAAWGLPLIYYYAIDSVRLSRWYHWLIFLAINVVVVTSITFPYINKTLSVHGYDFSNQLFHLVFINTIFSILLFIIVSFSLRWWSTNCRHTPIPE
jgi:Na+-driven multidrug efflux pump